MQERKWFGEGLQRYFCDVMRLAEGDAEELIPMLQSNHSTADDGKDGHRRPRRGDLQDAAVTSGTLW